MSASLFLKWCDEQGIVRLGELDAPAIRRYFVHLQERNLSSAYVHSHGRAIRTFCNYCVRDGLIVVSAHDRRTANRGILPT
jgi:site-specific recombinase XerD